MTKKRKQKAVRRPQRRWTAEELALLGTIPDREFAERFDRGQSNVAQRCARLGIARYVPTPTTPWTPAELQLLANNDDARVAQLTGKKLVEVQAKRKWLAK